MTGMRRVMTAGFREYFAGKAFSRDTRETFCFAILSYLIHHVSTYTIYTHITHILRGEFFQRENSSHNPWELEIVILTILYTIHCGFPQLLPLHIEILERDSPNTYHTHFECKVRFWSCWKALEEAICLVDAIGLNCVIRRAREDKASLSKLVAGAWRAQVHGVD